MEVQYVIYLCQGQGVRQGILVGPVVEGRHEGGEGEGGEREHQVKGISYGQQHQQAEENQRHLGIVFDTRTDHILG